MEILKVPEVVVSSLCLRNLAVRLRLARVNDIRELELVSAQFIAFISVRTFIASWMKKTGMLLPTISQLPSSV